MLPGVYLRFDPLSLFPLQALFGIQFRDILQPLLQRLLLKHSTARAAGGHVEAVQELPEKAGMIVGPLLRCASIRLSSDILPSEGAAIVVGPPPRADIIAGTGVVAAMMGAVNVAAMCSSWFAGAAMRVGAGLGAAISVGVVGSASDIRLASESSGWSAISAISSSCCAIRVRPSKRPCVPCN